MNKQDIKDRLDKLFSNEAFKIDQEIFLQELVLIAYKGVAEGIIKSFSFDKIHHEIQYHFDWYTEDEIKDIGIAKSLNMTVEQLLHARRCCFNPDED